LLDKFQLRKVDFTQFLFMGKKTLI